MAKQKGTKISQPIALDPELRDILEQHAVIPAPVVPKIEKLEKYIKVRAWTYSVDTKNAGVDPGTHVDLHAGGMAGEQVTYSATAETLAMALTKTICDALINEPKQATFLNADASKPGVTGPLFASMDDDQRTIHEARFFGSSSNQDGSKTVELDHKAAGFSYVDGSPVKRTHDPVVATLNAEAETELDRRQWVADELHTVPPYEHLAIDDDGVYFDTITFETFRDRMVIETAYAKAIADGVLPWTANVDPAAEDAIRDKSLHEAKNSPETRAADETTQVDADEPYDAGDARVKGDAWLASVTEEYGVTGEETPRPEDEVQTEPEIVTAPAKKSAKKKAAAPVVPVDAPTEGVQFA